LQLTGRANYQAFADFIKDQSIMKDPSQVAVKYYFESALFFFAKNKLWDIAKSVSTESITKLTKRINGGVNGLDSRIEITKEFYKLLTV
jgi:putative chitinase